MTKRIYWKGHRLDRPEVPFGPLLGQPTPKVCNFLSERLDPLVVLLDGTAKRHLSLFEEEN